MDDKERKAEQEHTVPSSTAAGGNVFNDYTAHNRTIMGVPDKPIDLKGMPRPLRYFGYFFMGAIVLGGVAFLVSWIVQRIG